jgi:hypothetical protein
LVNTKTEYFVSDGGFYKQTRILKGIAAESGGIFIVIKKINYWGINSNDYDRYVRICNQRSRKQEG